MNAAPSSPRVDQDALKRTAADAAVQLAKNDMVVGLGSGSTAAFAVEALARRHRQGLRFVGIPASQRTATQAKAATYSGNLILDCDFGLITDPARLEDRISRMVGVVESGLFIGRADPVFVADAAAVHRLDCAPAHRGRPPILVIMGVSGSGKSTIAEELSARLGWLFEEGDSLHPEANSAKMHAGIALTDADRLPWLERVAAWIDGQRAKREPGIITCSALNRTYRQIIIGDRPEVRLVYMRGSRDLIAEHLAGRHGHFMPPELLRSQIDVPEEPDPSEDPLTVDLGASAAQVADAIIRLLGNSVTISHGAAAQQTEGARMHWRNSA
jgi:carbohydrate kinase (thermoresistant glucokinase family)